MGNCPLCGTAAVCNEYRDFLEVRCTGCGGFILTRLAFDELGDDSDVKAELARQTRAIASGGGRGFLGADLVANLRKKLGERLSN